MEILDKISFHRHLKDAVKVRNVNKFYIDLKDSKFGQCYNCGSDPQSGF